MIEEIIDAIRSFDGHTKLQWGLDQMIEEIIDAANTRLQLNKASMGPRSHDRGNRHVLPTARLPELRQAIARAWELARAGQLPPPLVDSPKCPGCSLAKGIRTLWEQQRADLISNPFDLLTPIGGSFNFDPRGAWTALHELGSLLAIKNHDRFSRISAACSQLILLANARKITSCTFIARSTAALG